MKVVYSPRYHIDIGAHVFPTRKYQLVHAHLLEAGVITPADVIDPQPASWDDLALVHWVETQTPPSARLFSFGPTLTFRHYASYPTIDLYDVTPADLAAELTTPAPTFVLLDEANVEQQWLGQAPYANFQWLKDGPGLVRIGDQGSYALFRVGAR